MTYKTPLDYAFSDEFVGLRDTPQFVLERRRLIDAQIDSQRSRGIGVVQQLVELQKELESMRLINNTPLAQIEYIVSLVEERVALVERLIKELKQSN
jgi:hypothetical protein